MAHATRIKKKRSKRAAAVADATTTAAAAITIGSSSSSCVIPGRAFGSEAEAEYSSTSPGNRRRNSSSGPSSHGRLHPCLRACVCVCVSDFNANKRFELIYRPAVSCPLHIYERTLAPRRFVINLSDLVEKHVTIIYVHSKLHGRYGASTNDDRG